MHLRKDIKKVFSSNIITLSIAVISGFIIPAFLSLEDYANLKTFSLYLSFVGLLHFGFVDGIFVKYGGSIEKEIDRALIKGEHRFFIIFQMIISAIVVIISIAIQDPILLAISFAIIPFNFLSFYNLFYQALGEFTKYSKTIVISPIILFILNIVLIFIIETSNYWYFIVANIFSYFIVFIYFEFKFYVEYKDVKSTVKMVDIKSHFKIGSIILVGNSIALLLYSADRWMVKFALDLESFAYYSFAISMMTLINVFIKSITSIFYPYLSRNEDNLLPNKLKNYFLIIGSFFSITYFGFAVIVTYFMPKYYPALSIIAILFMGFPAIITIKALYVNLYKIQKKQMLYLKTTLGILVISLFLNVLAIVLFKSNFAIAIATTLSFFIWYFYSSRHFESITIQKREVYFISVFITLFIINTQLIELWLGMFSFISSLMASVYFFYKNDFRELIFILIKRKIKVEKEL
ncbi:hypothetical protein [Bacillus sp. AG4(2022)]|uniref:hypothetical protein n=1 Tax=Bacillus sp. AG4(2022) TaxID=2962594 RepID=UPI0028821023|nr:hypothetical protein [Bacillus sp. AG4(2022)]MDT0161600.1 hypothetical protein [Bacillus sp. AG4(2022)]